MKKISRRLPNSNLQRKTGLEKTLAKKESNPPGGNILTDETTEKLTDLAPAYVSQYNKVFAAEAALGNNTETKNEDAEACKVMNTAFMNAINLAVVMKVLKKGDRAFYGMEIESGNLLPMTNETEIEEVAAALIAGEAMRIAEGGTAIELPKISDVVAAAGKYNASLTKQSNFTDALKIEQGKLDALNLTVDDFFKVLWGEIEAHYAARPIETKRSLAREWGVVYAFVTVNVPVNIDVIDAITKVPIKGAQTMLILADTKKKTDEDGESRLFTGIVGEDDLDVTAPGYEAVIKKIDTSDEEELNITIEMHKIAA